MNTKRHYRRILFLVTMLSAAAFGTAQTSFDPGDGCLNVIDVSYAQGIGEYGDGGILANYLHEKFIDERFSIGPGSGYRHHNNYNLSAIPVFLSTHYFFLDKRFSPFVNLRVGGIALFNAKNVGTNEKYSISEEMEGFSLFMSPSVGVKMHITPNIGIMASICDDAYLVDAFDTNKNDYRNKLINSLGINIGIFFQIKGW
jgi:hypothetical protein